MRGHEVVSEQTPRACYVGVRGGDGVEAEDVACTPWRRLTSAEDEVYRSSNRVGGGAGIIRQVFGSRVRGESL